MERVIPRNAGGRQGVGLAVLAACAGAAVLCAAPVAAQTDYYNLDKNRPLRVEDAYATERYAVEFQASPLTLSGAPGVLLYAPSLEVKYGVLPGMELSAGLEGHVTRRDGETSVSLGEIELSTLYNLNTETLGVPALGLRATGHVPLEGGESPSLELKGIVTRALGGPWRAHVNGAAVLGSDAAERWWAGLAVDHVLPFRSLLLLAETYYARPRVGGVEGRVHSGAGLRYQLTPWTGVDAGVGTDWRGPEGQDWRVTFGVTTALGFRALMPVP